MKLAFPNPYGYKGADVLSTVDRCIQNVLMGRQTGKIKRKEYHGLIDRSTRIARHLFNMPSGYHRFNITREDVCGESEAARLARERMGALPPAVLAGSERAEYAPVIKLAQAAALE